MAVDIGSWVEKHRREAISLLQALVRTPSPSGQESDCAALVADAMRASGFDFMKVDELSDTLGVIRGGGGGPSLLMNGHIDHVLPGDMAEPYSGKLMDGSTFGVAGEVVYGRAACDMKAGVAAMVMAGTAISGLGIK